MLKKIRLTDFKSFVDEEVELAPLTLLVGANASGKSNFLDALRVLNGLTLDLTLREVLDGEEKTRPDAWPGIRGGSLGAAWGNAKGFILESTWLAPNSETPPNEEIPQQIEITHKVTCQISPPLVAAEWIQRGEERIRYPFTGPWRSLLGSASFFRLSSLASSESVDLPPLNSLHVAIGALRFLDIQPSAMRDYGRRGAPLGDEGKNFSGVLAELSDDPMVKYSFLTWLREVCAPEIEDLDFVEVKELGDVMAVFVEKNGVRISARSISDGALQFLGALLALRTAEPGDVLLIEEIGEGLHPTRIKYLLEILESAVHQQGIQVVATTHSPVLLQWLAPERLREVLIFGRVPDREGTLVRRLGDLPHFEEVIQRQGIEELFTTGWLEMAL